MPIAAVPEYLGKLNLSSASPGLRFGMYLPLWGKNNRTGELLWTTHDINYRVAGKDKQEREFKDENKTDSLKQTLNLNREDRDAIMALAKRQSALAEGFAASGRLLTLDALSVAPFTTGLGNEHPLENGFAFLNPYGLPYLPGSGVKGVLRQAARELAGVNTGEKWPIQSDWTAGAIEALFGKEDANDAQRGALSFWDVIPQIPGNNLAVEVMTAHQNHYYQNNDTPHESGQPNPINFLTVSPGSGFTFHVVCDYPFLSRIAPELAVDDRWKMLLQAAFEHAFDWLGFGAKTAVGYGAMEIDRTKLEAQRRREAQERAERQRQAEEAARREAEAEAARRRQAEFDALPESDKAIHRFQEALATITATPPLKENDYAPFKGLVNELAEQASGWTNTPDQSRAADAIEAAFERFGWAPSGLKSDKRKKRAKKNRDLVAGLRQ